MHFRRLFEVEDYLLDHVDRKSQDEGILRKLLTREKERERFYLLPGMGGRALRKKQKMMLHWSLAAGLFVSAIVALLFYWMSQS